MIAEIAACLLSVCSFHHHIICFNLLSTLAGHHFN